MTIEEVVTNFHKKVPIRKPVKYARVGDTWYLYTENVINGGAHLSTLIENGWFSVEGEKVLPVLPVDMPRDLKMIRVPIELQTVELDKK